MNYLVHKDFAESLSKLSNKGFNFASSYQKGLKPYLLACEGKTFDEAFYGLKITNNGERRINHAVKFDLGRACRMVIIKNKDMCHFLYAGIHQDVEKWLDKHRGLKTVIEADNAVISTIHVSKVGEKQQTPLVDQNMKKFNLCEQLNSTDQDFLFREDISPSTLGAIYSLDSMDTNDHIWSVLLEINDSKKSTAIFDILILLRQPKANSIRIQKIISDMKNKLIPFEDASPDEIEIIEGSSEVSVITLKKFDPKITRNTLESKNFRNWMLYMHPDQEKYVDKNYNGPALLKGVSGSGKTAIVVNRAIRLARDYPDKKIMVFTLNKALGKLIDDLVETAASELTNLSVMSLWPFCTQQLSVFDPKHPIHYGEETKNTNKHSHSDHIDEIWHEYYHQELRFYLADVLLPVHQSLLQNHIHPKEYLREEFDFIRSALPADERNKYLEIKREGRSFALQENFREIVLKGLSGWEKKMETIGTIDYLGLTSKLYEFYDQIEPLYDSILIDEMQDLGTLELKIIRKLVKEGENDLFLAGDNAQRVLTKQHDFSAANINIRGRSYEIYQNYRNTKEILDAANNVLEENLTGTTSWVEDINILQPEFAETSDFLPFIYDAKSISNELTYAVQYLQNQIIGSEDDQTACIAIVGYDLSELKLLANDLKVQLLDGTIKLENKKIFLSDLEQTKGFEFDHMVIVNCTSEALPNPNLPEEEAFRDLSRFYVAMTRARKNLVISYHNKISKFLVNSVDNYFITESWSNQIELSDNLKIAVVNEILRPERFQHCNQIGRDRYSNKSNYGALTGKELLFTIKAIGMSKERQDKLLKYVTGTRLKSKNARDSSWRNLNDLFREPQININATLAGGFDDVKKEVEYFRDLFEIDASNQSIITQEEVKIENESISSVTTKASNRWNVILHNTGICMHCGEPAIPGDYVCYACNPG